MEPPKPLLPLDGVLLIDHQLRYLRQAGIAEVMINLHHLGGKIRAHVGDGASGKAVFPVGYVVMNTTGVDPSVDFGGTWRQLPSLGCFTFERIG